MQPPEPSNAEGTGAAPPESISRAAQPARLRVSLTVPRGSRLRVTLEAQPHTDQDRAEVELRPSTSVRAQWVAGQALRRVEEALARLPLSLGSLLFGLSLAVYLTTRLIGLADFPIYFFSDEALQSMVAADFVRDRFHNYDRELLPAYFQNVDKYSLGVTVYLQTLPNLALGRSVWTVRGLAVLVTLLAAAVVGLTLRDIFQIPIWWAGTLLLSIAPTWFLHSRTAFETTTMVSFYAAGLYFYLLYRYRSPRFLYPALILFALSFYTYSPAQIIVPVTGILLFIADFDYHRANRLIALRGLGLLGLLGLPYLRFRLAHPAALHEYLTMLDSYWVQPLPLHEKLIRYASNYAYLISPFYWYLPNEHDSIRHLMKGYGHLQWFCLPFALLGLWVAVKNFRVPAHRALLASLLAAPTAAALVEAPSSITRCLMLVIPATLLTGLGLWRALAWLETRRILRLTYRETTSIGLFLLLSFYNLAMLRDALLNGPTWYQNYGLNGMQYGARQVFGAIQEHLRQDPQADITLSPNWSFSVHELARFFLKEPVPIQIGSIDNFLNKKQPLSAKSLLILPPPEYEQAMASDKFRDIFIERILPYPDGAPGFYFVRMKYVENIDELLAKELEQLLRLQPGQVFIGGQEIKVMHSLLDMGTIADAFDGNPDTLVRTMAANPAVVELVFPQERTIHGVTILYGTTVVEAMVKLYISDSDTESLLFKDTLDGRLSQPETTLDFGRAIITRKIRLEVLDTTQGQPGNVHLWEIHLW